MTVEVAFVAYDIYQEEGSNLFSNSYELLLLLSVVLVIPHFLARSRGSQMMSVCVCECVCVCVILHLTKAYFCSFKIFESCSKPDHMICNIESAFISRSLLHAPAEDNIVLGQVYLVKS